MKTVKCSDTVPEGGCDHTVTTATADEAKQKFGEHAAEAHADMMEKSTEEDKGKWGKNFDENVWPNAKEDEQ